MHRLVACGLIMLLRTIIVQCVLVCDNCVDSYVIIIDDFACDVIPIWKFNVLVCRGGRYWFNILVYRRVGVIGSIYLYIEGWAFNVLIYRGGRYWYTVLVQEHIRMGSLSKSA